MRRRACAAVAAIAGMAIAASAGAADAVSASHDDHDHDAARITDARAHDPAVQDRRRATLAQAEAALARGDTERALDAFERAAQMLHAPDTEMGLVRSYLQAGQYRRALAFCAHTAGAHLEAAPAAALYAWLLRAGAQQAYAQRVLDDAARRAPADAIVAATRAAFAAPLPRADAALLDLPHRMAPLPTGATIDAGARVVASGVLLPGGRAVLVPALGTLAPAATLWIRDGLGRSRRAHADARGAIAGTLLLVIDVADRDANVAPADAAAWPAARDPYAGSPGYVVDYAAGDAAASQWPWLHAGFFAAAASPAAPAAPAATAATASTATPASPDAHDATSRPLGFAAGRTRAGGVVFDGAGRWAGLVVAGGDATRPARFVPASALRAAWADAPQPPAESAPARAGADEIYERALRSTVQVIVR